MPQKELVVEHFDRWAESDRWSALYDRTLDPVRSYNFIVRMDRVAELSEPLIQPGARVLDIGCGTGISAPFYLERGCAYHGVDISEQMADQARANVASEQAAFGVGDVEAGLEMPDGQFDIVLALGLLEYLDDLGAACAEIVRVARPGGSIIVSVPRRLCLQNISKTVLSPILTNAYALVKWALGKSTPPHAVYHRRFRARELEKLFADLGCAKSGEAHYNLEVAAYPLNRVVPRLTCALKRRVERFRESWMRVFATGYILRCQKAAE